ncbi:MAG: S8 family serine peptidase, partial [Dinghuibacter sp.]|nr:S8 family serine peptidase [Dinghuibacter sp.]
MSPAFLQQFINKENGTVVLNKQQQFKLVCDDNIELINVYKEVGVPPRITRHIPEHNYYIVSISDSSLLKKIIALPSVSFIDVFTIPREELEVGNYDPTLNYINVLQQKFPQANGNGLTASVKENLFDTLDIDFKGRYLASGIASNTPSSHATIMASLLAGGGNTSSGSLGVAPGVQLTSATYDNLLPEPPTYFQQFNISTQNHSYGTTVENFYGAEARAYDQQLNSRTTLAHIFSAGNSGNVTPGTGVYAGLPGTANLTGNFKMAKNIISVGATDSFARIPTAISKGPAYDGRLKPEITAFAEDGSSGAAAIVSGAVIALQHLYRQLYGVLPETALLRAILFNSATDVGAPGIDFASGYGSLNALRAAENINNGRFFSGA